MKKEQKAKEVLVKFLNYWKDNNYKEMYELTTKTWKSNNTKANLKNIIPNRIKSYKITEISESTSCVYDIDVTVRIKGLDKKIKVRLISEIEEYRPSLDGGFGVNPVSVIRNLN